MKLWQLRGSDQPGDLDKLVEEFTAGEDARLDQALVQYDLLGSLAHVCGLEEIGVLSPSEAQKLKDALVELLGRDLTITAEDEDVHSKVENSLTEQLGQLGEKLHTGRSRNDQVLLDTFLMTKDRILAIVEKLLRLSRTLLELSRGGEEIPLPGYTHSRRATLSSVGLWASSFCQSLLDGLGPLEAAFELFDRCPLGAGAGYGVPLTLAREKVADLLGFSQPLTNSLAAINSRGKYEFSLLSALGAIQLDLAKISSDLILFSREEFGFFSLPRAATTGSSIMPQKANPDPLELIRGRGGSLLGAISGTYGSISGLPSGYNRDTQETKELLFKGLKLTESSLEILPPILSALEIDQEKIMAAIGEEILATDRAFQLVEEGVPFRSAYREVKESLAEKSEQEGEKVELEEIKKLLRRRDHSGGPGELRLDDLEKRLRKEESKWDDRRQAFDSKLEELLNN